MKELEFYISFWLHNPLSEFENLFNDDPPIHWLASKDTLEVSVDYFSLEEEKYFEHKYFGNWSCLSKHGVPRLEVLENAHLVLISQDECIFKKDDDRTGAWRMEGYNDCKKKKSEGKGLTVSGFSSDVLGFLTSIEVEIQSDERYYREEFPLIRSFSKT